MKFSIVIPAYNASRFIRKAVDSVLKQSYGDFEIVVVNDGSKDSTLQVLSEISDHRLRVISQLNQGVSVARNTGIQNATGDYICFLDADDQYMADYLQYLSQAMHDFPHFPFFVTRYCIRTTDGTTREVNQPATGRVWQIEDVPAENIKLQYGELMCTGCVCIRRDMFSLYGLFEPGIKLGEDSDMWTRIYLRTGIVYIDKVTLQVNRDGSEATKEYQRYFNPDPLGRMPGFLADTTIPSGVKESLMREYERKKLSVVRSYIYIGDKKQARKWMSQIDRSLLPRRRVMITEACLLIPSCIIRFALKQKYKGIFR